ncbi:MAG: TlpA family protein disulfide reductase [Selenomonadaceae bacterium]|nr:TlpA family protein disulfide reductase [Selenomonadaceae bacterium]
MNKVLILTAALALSASMIMTGCDDSDNTSEYNENVPNPAAMEVQVSGKFPTFSAKDLNGNQITNDIFAKKKLTVVNVWGTFCPPCIGEMPELGKWAKDMPNDVQLIGIVCDVRGDNDTQTINAAKEILGDARADFINIVPNSEIAQYLSNVEAVPTTIFVNSKGEVVGDPIIGADVDGYKQFVKDYLNE